MMEECTKRTCMVGGTGYCDKCGTPFILRQEFYVVETDQWTVCVCDECASSESEASTVANVILSLMLL